MTRKVSYPTVSVEKRREKKDLVSPKAKSMEVGRRKLCLKGPKAMSKEVEAS